MRIHVLPDRAGIGTIGAALVAAAVRDTPDLLLGVATGSSPEPVYAALAARVAGGLDLGGVSAVALDEYVGLPVDHPESYRSVVRRTVVRPLRLDPARVAVPDGTAADPSAAADAYDAAIVARGGVDLQILGLGHNGHVAFNEPGSSFTSRTRVVALTARTRAANARFFGGDVDAVPTHAVTQGIGTVLQARRLLLVVTGRDKAPVVAAALTGPVDEFCPGSALQTHPDVTVLLDEAAATYLDASLLDDPDRTCAAAGAR